MKYRTILADPPWNEQGGGQCKRGADRHYPLMSTPAIIAYLSQIRTEPDAHLYLWVTNNFLEDGLLVMRKLGFRYVTNLAWVKDRFGLGQYFRGQHELLLFGVKGQPPYKERNGGGPVLTTVINAKRREHSQKPDEQYAMIEATSYAPYIEAFARQPRPGWDVIGNESGNDPQQKFF